MGYELWKPRLVEIPGHFNYSTPTQPIEEQLKLIDFPEVLPQDFMSRRDENDAFDQIGNVFQEFNHLEFFLLGADDDVEFKKVNQMQNMLVVKY
jgi:hypothetical protein